MSTLPFNDLIFPVKCPYCKQIGQFRLTNYYSPYHPMEKPDVTRLTHFNIKSFSIMIECHKCNAAFVVQRSLSQILAE